MTIQVYATLDYRVRTQVQPIADLLSTRNIHVFDTLTREGLTYALILNTPEEEIETLRARATGNYDSRRTYFKQIYIPPKTIRPSALQMWDSDVKAFYLKWEAANRRKCSVKSLKHLLLKN